ncbi:MAG: hypothetical protein HOO90_08220 [Methylotenera sp.]|uniref:hypothetical protein n=1 Tax=Methylotenera sp. TaxID=2051956 RepID=UPI0018461437|nr:hypothetical protein [Methylotenera sp.]NOU25508.1 hypothetical protein [Methylotenera sp.]
MSKKDDDSLGALLVIAIAAIVAVGAVLLWLGKILYRGYQAYQLENKTKPITKLPENKPYLSSLNVAEPQLNTINDPWYEHCLAIEAAWIRKDYDWARLQLQKIAYGMVAKDVTDGQRAEFTKLMTMFAQEDPLYNEIISQVKPLIQQQPGIIQSSVYPYFQNYDQETIRYVLYFAHELGDIYRIKKGRSYELYPAGQTIDGEIIND